MTKPAKKSTVSDQARAKSSSEWYTPKYIIDALVKGAGKQFDLDVCSPREKHWTAKRALTPKQDGLKTKWPKRAFIWCNPPYGFPLPWAEKMLDHALVGNPPGNAVMLVNVSGSSKWWETLMPAATALLIIGERLRFVDIKGKPSAQVNPLTSVLIGFGPIGQRAVAGAYLCEPRLDGTFLIPRGKQAVLEHFFGDDDAMWEAAGIGTPADVPGYQHGIDPEPIDPMPGIIAQRKANIAKADADRDKRAKLEKQARTKPRKRRKTASRSASSKGKKPARGRAPARRR